MTEQTTTEAAKPEKDALRLAPAVEPGAEAVSTESIATNADAQLKHKSTKAAKPKKDASRLAPAAEPGAETVGSNADTQLKSRAAVRSAQRTNKKEKTSKNGTEDDSEPDFLSNESDEESLPSQGSYAAGGTASSENGFLGHDARQVDAEYSRESASQGAFKVEAQLVTEDEPIDLEAVENKIRDEYLNNTVAATVVEKDDTPRSNCSRGLKLTLAVVAVLVVTAIVVVVVTNSKTPPPPPSASPPPTSAPELFQVLIDEDAINLELLSENGGEKKAFDWLDEENAVSLSAEQLVQRYVAALLYFSLDEKEVLQSDLGFPSDTHECDWNSDQIGIRCNDMRKINEIRFPENQLSGTIPSALGLLTDLQSLDLTSNFLRGTLPSELGDATKLEMLLLGSNQLTGTLPVEYAQLTNMQDFEISGNFLLGEIPNEYETAWQDYSPDWFTPAVCEFEIIDFDFICPPPIEYSCVAQPTTMQLEFIPNVCSNSVNFVNALSNGSVLEGDLGTSTCEDVNSGLLESSLGEETFFVEISEFPEGQPLYGFGNSRTVSAGTRFEVTVNNIATEFLPERLYFSLFEWDVSKEEKGDLIQVVSFQPSCGGNLLDLIGSFQPREYRNKFVDDTPPVPDDYKFFLDFDVQVTPGFNIDYISIVELPTVPGLFPPNVFEPDLDESGPISSYQGLVELFPFDSDLIITIGAGGVGGGGDPCYDVIGLTFDLDETCDILF